MYKKITDNPTLIRDTTNNAIINTSPDGYYAAKARKRKSKQFQNEINTLKQEMAEIKSLLKTLINNKNA